MLKKNSVNIKTENLDSWFAITGFTLPRTEGELKRFDKLYQDFEFKLTGKELDPHKIWNDQVQVHINPSVEILEFDFKPLRMAARGLNDLTDEVKNKMKLNQQNA